MKFLFLNTIAMLVITISGCGGDNSEDNRSNLIGEWERSFERNSSNGVQRMEITPLNEFRFTEVGDYLIMTEWYSGLETQRIYSFTVNPAQPIINITNTSFTASEVVGSALISTVEDGVEVVSWPITSAELTYNYQLVEDSNTLILSVGGLSLEFHRI